jgi:hypothetical protein
LLKLFRAKEPDHKRIETDQTATLVDESPVSIKTQITNETTDNSRKQNKCNYLVHKITGKETLQGLGLKYGVTVQIIISTFSYFFQGI